MRFPVSLAALALVATVQPATAADPTPVERHLALQKAMVAARQFLDVSMPADAIAALEAELPNADGSKPYLTLLREAYLAELYRLEKAATPDTAKVEKLRRKLGLLGAAVPEKSPAAKPVAAPAARPEVPALPDPDFGAPPAAPAADPTPDRVPAAVALFKRGDFKQAAAAFAEIGTDKLTADQKAAWAYCRVRVAADCLKSPTCDAACAAAHAADIAEALKLVPQHAELQKVGQAVIASAKAKGGSAAAPIATATGDGVETPSFRVRCAGNRQLADAVAKAAEANRKAIFERWSGPPAGPWDVKCQIVIHPTAEAYAKATGRPADSTGTAAVRLTDRRATERRIDLRADDAAITSNALPRELTHVVMADLFPDKPAPKWAVEGMAILAGSPEEAARYTRTLPRCARDGDWFALAQLMEMKDFPAEKITGFYCESVSLTEYLIRVAGGERNFTIFLRDCQRYGTPQALRRQLNIAGPEALEGAWKRSALEVGRAQAP
jgi:hypothetical protein